MRVRRLAAVFLLTTLVAPLPAAAGEPLLQEGFDDPALPGWELGPGTTVEGAVLRVPGGGFAFHGVGQADLELTLRFRRDPAVQAAIHYRTTDAGGYSVVLSPESVALRRDQEGSREVIAEVPAAVPAGVWIDLAIAVGGAEHAVALGGEAVLQAADPNPLSDGGAIGLAAEGEGVVEYDDLVVTTADVTSPPDPTLSWVRTGGPLGGLGYDVRMHPQHPDLLFVTDAFAGVHLSTDGGVTWSPSNTGITARTGTSGDSIPVFSLTIDPNDADIIWIGTQSTRGIFKSVDGGRTWVEKTNGIIEEEGISFRGFAVTPGSSDIVYAAAEVASFAWAGQELIGREFDRTQGVVYKTMDGGENWNAVWRGDNLARYVLIDPRDPNVLYVSTGIFDREAANSDPIAKTPGGEGILKSYDGGLTWQHVNNGLHNLYVGSLFMHPTDPDVLLAGTSNNQYHEGGGAYLTTDGGATWTRTLTAIGVQSVEFATADPDVAYALGSDGVFRSEDGGRTWEQMTGAVNQDDPAGWGPPGVRAGFPIDVQVDPRDPNRLFANNYGGGNFLSNDGGRSWVVASRGYTGAQVRALAAAPGAPGGVFVAARSGLFTTVDGGNEWVGILDEDDKRLEWNAIAVDPVDPRHVVAGTNWGAGIALTTDGGATWRIAATGPEGTGWRALAFAPSDPLTVYSGSGAFGSAGGFSPDRPATGVWVSRDGGRSWEEANDDRTAAAHIAALAVHPQDPLVVYAASTHDGLLKTVDGGVTWTALDTGIPASIPAYSIALDPIHPEVVLVGYGGRAIRRSPDGGATWHDAAAGLAPESQITALVFHPTDASVFAADVFSGVYRSTDGGLSWESSNDGLRTRAVTSLAISSDGNHLYAGTDGEGVFRLDLSGTPPEPPAETAPSIPTSLPGTTIAPTTVPPTPVAAGTDADDGDAGIVPFLVGAAILVVLLGGGGWILWRRAPR